MMHIQLINESSYNKHHKLKIHSLCFYYRNHKHVLYGSFTINDEVFIFSFNIFDIYRSYNSKSNKKSSSKTHSKTSNSNQSNSSSKYSNTKQQQQQQQANASSSSSLASSNNNSKNNLQEQSKQQKLASSTPTPAQTTNNSILTTPISTNTNNTSEDLNETSKKVKFDKNGPLAEAMSIVEAEVAAAAAAAAASQLPGDFEFNSYMSNLVNTTPHTNVMNESKSESGGGGTGGTGGGSVKLNHEISVESTKNDTNSDEEDIVDATIPKLLNEKEITATTTPTSSTIDVKEVDGQPKLTTAVVSAKSANDSSVLIQTENIKKNIVFDVFANATTTAHIPPPPLPNHIHQHQNHKNMFLGPQINTKNFHANNTSNNTSNTNNNNNNNGLNLSNFLNVRFEICSNQESTSKSKSKYKKCIKILSVSSRPLSTLMGTIVSDNAVVADIQLKTYEFTEKCLSFRLASIDMNAAEMGATTRSNFDIKLINLYEKFLCALVNFTTSTYSRIWSGFFFLLSYTGSGNNLTSLITAGF